MTRFSPLALLLFACTGTMTGDSTDATDSPSDSPAFDGGPFTPDSDGGSPTPDRDGGGPTTDGSTPGPALCDPACGEGEVCVDGTCDATITGVAAIDGVLLGDPSRYDEEVLISQDPDLSWRPSRLYKWRDFARGVAMMHRVGVGEHRLWLGDPDASDEVRTQQALVNLAAFLAQSMKETIRYDACDENNWDSTNGYQISNSCGQLGQDYGNYDCEMACPRDPTMRATAVTHATWYGAPGPMFCAPDSELQAAGLLTADGRTGRWNHGHDCYPYPATEADFTPSGPAWSRPECEVYEGQRAGAWVWDGSGESVEGCCWWGRGVIQTTGRCNFGVLNHFLGRTHLNPAEHAPPATVLYPDIDFCQDPESICASTDHPELKWVAGLFYWMSTVQTYDEDGWAYLDQLRSFVAGGLGGNAFIDAVSGIVNRGCHDAPCATGPVDGVDDRRENFDTVLRVMGLR